jgi:lysophospholipase L1-like esterase
MTILKALMLLMLISAVLTPVAFAQKQPSEPANPQLPTLWIIGDSTVHNGSKGEMGWGEVIDKQFDTSRINVVNRAIGGRSSRTFRSEGRWDLILKEAKPGDFVLIQFGHNDGGPLSGDNRERGSIRGIGDDSKEVTLSLPPKTGQKETVYSFGWYIRAYCKEAQEKKMIPIVCSWIPHCPQAKPGDTAAHPVAPTTMTSYQLWAKQSADAAGAPFIDLNTLVMKKYEAYTFDEIKQKFFTAADNTHTSPAGAEINADCAIEGLQAIDTPLKGYVKTKAKD